MRILVVLSGVLLFGGCIKDNTETHYVPKISDYYPLKEGSTWVWNVDSIYFDAFFERIDTFHFQIRERIDTFFQDNLGRPAARIERSKAVDSGVWVFQEMCYGIVDLDHFEKVESNRRYIKISLPITEEAIWDMNSRNDLSQKLVFYDMTGGPFNGKYLQSDKAISIKTSPIVNKLEEQIYEEVYGRNLGLLFYRKVNKQTVSGKFNGYDVTYQLSQFN